jgi:hypothetical protein
VGVREELVEGAQPRDRQGVAQNTRGHPFRDVIAPHGSELAGALNLEVQPGGAKLVPQAPAEGVSPLSPRGPLNAATALSASSQ